MTYDVGNPAHNPAWLASELKKARKALATVPAWAGGTMAQSDLEARRQAARPDHSVEALISRMTLAFDAMEARAQTAEAAIVEWKKEEVLWKETEAELLARCERAEAAVLEGPEWVTSDYEPNMLCCKTCRRYKEYGHMPDCLRAELEAKRARPS